MGRKSPRMKLGQKIMNFLMDKNCHIMGKEPTEKAENSTHLHQKGGGDMEGSWGYAGMQRSGCPC